MQKDQAQVGSWVVVSVDNARGTKLARGDRGRIESSPIGLGNDSIVAKFDGQGSCVVHLDDVEAA